MNYWIIKAQLTAVALDAKRNELIKALRRGVPLRATGRSPLLQLQRDWDWLAQEMRELNGIVERRSAAY